MNCPTYRRLERQALRMHEMLDRLDVDPVALIHLKNGHAYAEARWTCFLCGTSDKCLGWLVGLDREDKNPDFCPNLPVFQTCKRKHPEIMSGAHDMSKP